MARLDLDARRAEYEDQNHQVVLGGQEWTLPARFPLMVAQELSAGHVDRAIAGLFGEDAVDLLAPLLNDDDLERIMIDLYDMDPNAAGQAATVTRTARTNGGKRVKATR